MIETYININTNEELIIQEKSTSIPYKLLIILFAILSFHFAARLDANLRKKLIKYNGINYYVDNGLINYNRYYLYNYIQNLRNSDYFNITYMNYDFSVKYNMVRIEFNIGFFENDDIYIAPSDLALYKGIQMVCMLEIVASQKVIFTFPHIIDNKYFQCIEYFNMNEHVSIGIKLYQTFDFIKSYSIRFVSEEKFNLNNFYYQNENLFDPIYINQQYINRAKKINANTDIQTPKLKSTYLQYPYCTLRRRAIKNYEKWYFRNIYNDHFCFCVGSGCLLNVDQNCKQMFYISQMDKNQHLYKNTDFLFVDFIFQEYSHDDTFPVFAEMYNRSYSVHYLTENYKIYSDYCNDVPNCQSMIYVKRANYTINGDFIEKYFTMFLKLKAVVGSRQLNFYSNVFYSTDYITYIIIGHSVLYFKYFSDEKDVYEKRKFDKLILPPSEKVINLAKSFGWTDDDILQINFPRWDKYNNLNETKKGYINITVTEKVILDNVNVSESYMNNISNSLSNIKETNLVEIINKTITIREERTIFMFFSWRNFAKDNEISSYYFENITKILEDEKLNEILEKENVKIYFSIHGLVINKYRNTYRSQLYYNKHIDWIEPQDIADCIAKSELIITDFSTLIFDFVYMRKPYILYIPDIDDPEVTELYKPEYFEFYKNIKSRHFNFENVVFSVNELVEKINYYINTEFTLDEKIKSFYDSFGIRKENNIEHLINYLINL